MSDQSILVIDDSATIRKLVDTHLSPAGYRVILAPNAEEGIALALQNRPDLILLDHQLPGTTGYDVCCRLVESPELQQIPVVVSSTLRKKAYAEYLELDNVVDMLPKPYSEDLLRTTVANALETAAMVVSSQSQGTAVPETIDQVGDADLAGSFVGFSLRELVDFLNNGQKSGVLEIEAERIRLWIHLDGGRIQGVSATGIGEAELGELTDRLPESLAKLAPVLKLTVGGRSCAEVDGFIQLLDRKVLDPRLMTKLLRYQAAMLLRLGFTGRLSAFRFGRGAAAGSLPRNLPLNLSLLALLIEGAAHGDPLEPRPPADALYARRAIRGQNLDRAGLSAQHMKIMNLLAQPKSADQLAEQLGQPPEQVRRALEGFLLAEWIEVRAAQPAPAPVAPPVDATVTQTTGAE